MTRDQTDRPVSIPDLELCYNSLLVLNHNALVVDPAADVEDGGGETAGDEEGGEPGRGEREEDGGETEEVRDHLVSEDSS